MPTASVGIILQARLGSTRLPGKVLKSLAGKPLLEQIIERLKLCKKVDRMVIATSDLREDDEIELFAKQRDLLLFRGSELDVLDRFYQCAKRYQLDHIVRACGDTPFVCPIECDRLIDLYLKSQVSYASGMPELGSGYPIGIALEILSFEALEKSWRNGEKPNHREHVNEYIHENPRIFKQIVLKAPPEKQGEPHMHLTVDTMEQLEFAEMIYQRYRSRHASSFVPAEWVINEINSKRVNISHEGI